MGWFKTQVDSLSLSTWMNVDECACVVIIELLCLYRATISSKGYPSSLFLSSNHLFIRSRKGNKLPSRSGQLSTLLLLCSHCSIMPIWCLSLASHWKFPLTYLFNRCSFHYSNISSFIPQLSIKLNNSDNSNFSRFYSTWFHSKRELLWKIVDFPLGWLGFTWLGFTSPRTPRCAWEVAHDVANEKKGRNAAAAATTTKT